MTAFIDKKMLDTSLILQLTHTVKRNLQNNVFFLKKYFERNGFAITKSVVLKESSRLVTDFSTIIFFLQQLSATLCSYITEAQSNRTWAFLFSK